MTEQLAEELAGAGGLSEQEAVGQQDLAVENGRLVGRVGVVMRGEKLRGDATVQETRGQDFFSDWDARSLGEQTGERDEAKKRGRDRHRKRTFGVL